MGTGCAITTFQPMARSTANETRATAPRPRASAKTSVVFSQGRQSEQGTGGDEIEAASGRAPTRSLANGSASQRRDATMNRHARTPSARACRPARRRAAAAAMPALRVRRLPSLCRGHRARRGDQPVSSGGDAVIAALAAMTDTPWSRSIPRAARRTAYGRPHRRSPVHRLHALPLRLPLDAIIGAAKRMHTVLPSLCTGCELCIAPCPVDCIVIVPAGRVWSPADATRRVNASTQLRPRGAPRTMRKVIRQRRPNRCPRRRAHFARRPSPPRCPARAARRAALPAVDVRRRTARALPFPTDHACRLFP